MAVYFHGSGSASLAGVLSDEMPGLMCTGELLKRGRVPYCGELKYGIKGYGKGGINMIFLSVVPEIAIKGAVKYALSEGKKIFSLEMCSETIQKITQIIPTIERKIAENKPRKHQEEKNKVREYYSQLYELDLVYFKLMSTIIEKQLQQYPLLEPKSQEIISHPFPVIYKIYYEGEVVPINSDCSLERGIAEPIGLENIEIFAPSNKLDIVYLFGKNVRVSSFLDLSYLGYISLDNKNSIDQLLSKYR
jgi:hypothetical protein